MRKFSKRKDRSVETIHPVKWNNKNWNKINGYSGNYGKISNEETNAQTKRILENEKKHTKIIKMMNGRENIITEPIGIKIKIGGFYDQYYVTKDDNLGFEEIPWKIQVAKN